MEQSRMDEMYTQFCEEAGIVMDTERDRQDHAARGHLYDDPGSDVHDYEPMP